MEGVHPIISSVLAVFDAIGGWFTESIGDYSSIFYGADGLTWLGTLGVAGLAFSVVFLFVGIIQRFLKFGG